MSLAWVLHADILRGRVTFGERSFPMSNKCSGGHAEQWTRLGRLELQIASGEPGYCRPECIDNQIVDGTYLGLDDTTEWELKGDFVSWLAEAAKVVTVSLSQTGLRTDDKDSEADESADDGPHGKDVYENGSDVDDASEKRVHGGARATEKKTKPGRALPAARMTRY